MTRHSTLTVVHHRSRLRFTPCLHRRRRNHRIRRRQIPHPHIRKISAEGKTRDRPLKPHPLGPQRPPAIVKTRRRPCPPQPARTRHPRPDRRIRRHQSGGLEILPNPIRLIRKLSRKGRRKFRRHHPTRIAQRQILPRRPQRKIRVQIRPHHPPIFPRRKHHQKLPRPQGDRRKNPLIIVARIIRQRPPRQVHRHRSRVLHLDPIRVCQILISQSRDIVRHKLRDDHPPLSGNHRQQKYQSNPKSLKGHIIVITQ